MKKLLIDLIRITLMFGIIALIHRLTFFEPLTSPTFWVGAGILAGMRIVIWTFTKLMWWRYPAFMESWSETISPEDHKRNREILRMDNERLRSERRKKRKSIRLVS